MSFHGFDPGDHNNWYQSPHLGPLLASPAAYGCGFSDGYHSSPYHSYGSSTCEFTQFSLHPNPYPPLQLNPSATIINGHLLPHQFPCVPPTHSQFFPPPYLQPIHPIAPQPLTTTPQSPSIPTYHSPHPNPNLWIHPSISQSHSQPIYHSAPPPSASEQPRLISDLKQVEPAFPLHPISMEPDQIHKDQMEARISKTHDSFEAIRSEQSTFQAEILAELRQLRLGPKNPVTEANSNLLKFGSLPAGSLTLTVANGSSSTLSASSRGISISEKPNLNLSPHEVILGLNKDFTTAFVNGNHSEHTTTAVVTEELVLNVDKNIASGVTGVKFSDSYGSDVANSIVWRNDAQTHSFQHTSFRDGSSAGYGVLGSHNHNSVGNIRVDFHEREEKELEDEADEDDNEDEGENDGVESYGDGESYSDDFQSIDGHIMTDSDEEVVTDDEGSRVCIKEEALHEHYSIKTLVPQVFTTIISGSQYFQAAFYGVLCDVSKLYNHSSWNHKDGEKNWALDDMIEIMNGNALLCIYARCRVISDAMQLFGDMAGTNEVTFMAMMGELKKKDKVVEAFEMFKLMWRKGVQIDSTSLFVDIERDPSFNALPLLKAIIKCKLVASEVYDLFTRVAELMVTRQVEPILHKCIQILSHFLNDYPLSDKRFQQYLDFLLSNLSLSWYLGKKQQLWSVVAQVLRLLVEVGVMKKQFHKHINSVLQVTESILQSAIDAVTHDSPHETTILFWKAAFYSLVMLKEILNQFHDLCFDRDLEDIWEAIYVYLCCQLKAQLIGDAADKLITQNLAFTVCGLHYLMGHIECGDSLSSILGFCAKECGEFGVKEHSDGRTFDSYQFTYISVQVHVEDPITEMSSSGGENINVLKFKSFASYLGITTFFINALQQSGHEILSQPIMVEVYAPSDIHLHDISLVPGESYVLTLEEAPKIDANVEFTSLELLQNEYQIDQVDVKAVIAIVIIQLHSNETTELCKGMDKLLQAFGIYIAFAYFAYHLCSVGPQLLIEQFIDVAFVGNFYDTNVDQWLPAHDERSFCEGTKRISRRLLTLLTVHHFNNKMVQQFSYLQIILKKLIQAELQVCKSNLDKLSDSSFLVWSFQLLESKISFERPQPQVYHVGSRKTLRIIGFYDSSGHQPLAWCTFNPCSEDNSHIFLVDILGGFCLVALCSIEVTLVGMLNIIVAASLCVVCLTNVLLKSIASFLSWKLSSYYCKCNSILPIVVIVDASEQIQQSFIRIVLYSMFVSYIMMAQKIIVEDNTKQVGTAWTFESTDIITGSIKMFNDEWGQPTSKLDCIILILEIATSCYELQDTFANVRMGMMTPSYTSNDNLGVHEATKMTKLADKGNVSFHQWGITFFIFYFEFVYHLFMSQCCWYNILGVASEPTIIFKMLHMVDFCQDAPHAPRFSFRI